MLNIAVCDDEINELSNMVLLLNQYGFGTKSMVHVVEKHGGICRFSLKDGWFIFQATV